MKNSISLELSGICLIMYAFPFLYYGRGMFGQEFDMTAIELLLFIWSVVTIVAGVLIIMNKIRYAAAAVMSISAGLFTAALMAEYWSLWIGTIKDSGTYIAVPRYFILYPLLWSLSLILYAVMLYLRGPAALVLAFASVGSQIASLILSLRLTDHMTGHQTIFPFLFAAAMSAAALFAGAHLARRE